LPEHTADDPHYDDDIAGEVARVQSAVSPHPNETRVQAITRHLNHTVSEGFVGNPAPDCPPTEEYTPYIPHPPHKPFPIALVNRIPYGTPNHGSVVTPQNEAWLSGMRNAKKNVFIQTPDLNAEPLIPAIIEACERGVDVFCYVCLGYNDAGELLPMQGGTNEMIANKLYTTISPPHRQNLHWFWYVGKDQLEPIVAKNPRRTCHIKLMIVDELVAIQGSGNQDTQSWYHSQEVNVMLESRELCKAWIDGLRRNQNTHLYGQVSKEDGIWRDKDGNQAEGVIGIDPGSFSWAKGIVGAVKRVQGTGGF
jgi:phosphatidylserine/phosphatidylglycerophosphate/cardiolipin synthase-like enzyme